ncbi:SP_0009 family protein [Streptococcus cameli]
MTENILDTIKKFLSFSDEKLEELSVKNQEIRIEKEK